MSQTKNTIVSFRVPTEMKQKIQEIAKEQKRTIGSIIREAMERFVEESERKKKRP